MDVELYEARHAFVWTLGRDLVDVLKPQTGESIVDLSCGTGQLTAEISSRGAQVIGIDSSPAMVAQARANFPREEFRLVDIASFAVAEPVDAVFCNAPVAWPEPAEATLQRVAAALKPGGRLVAEFGGQGNLRQVLQGVEAVLGTDAVHEWFSPTAQEFTDLLGANGMEPSLLKEFKRPTQLEGPNGMEDWLEIFGASLLATVPVAQRAMKRRAVVEQVRPYLFCDGTWYADYCRLRVVAVKG